MSTRVSWITGLLILLGGLGVWLVRFSRSAVDIVALPASATGRGVPDESLRRLQSSLDEMLRDGLEAIRSLDATPGVVSSSPHPPPLTAEGREAIPWPRGLPRTRDDLAIWFMNAPDHVKATALVRHVMLNQRDRPISEDESAQLESITAAFRRDLSPMMGCYRQSRDAEMASLADAGLVAPAVFPVPTDEEIRRFARLVAGTPEEAERYYEEFRRNPPVGSMAGLSHLEHRGKVYLFSQFKSLPVSDSMHTQIQFFSLEYLATVCAWFECRHLTDSATVASILDAASKFTQATKRAKETSARSRR